MKKTIESKAADTILETKQTVTIGAKTYQVAPPSVRTIIQASKLIALLPAVKLDAENILMESLVIAKNCELLGEILAVLILGGQTPAPRTFIDRITRRKQQDPVRELANELIDNASPFQLRTATTEILKAMEIGDFFAITASLLEISLLGATRETETTASGL